MPGPSSVLDLTRVLNTAARLSPVPTWVRVGSGLGFSKFQTAATTIALNLYSLPAGAVVHAHKIKHSTAFAGTSVTAVTLSVGISGTAAKYAPAFDVFQTVSGTATQLSTTAGTESDSAATQITATMTATGANLSALTAGQVDVWALLSLPN